MNRKINISSEHSLKDLTSISQTTLSLAKQILGKNGLMELEILRHWHEIVGEKLAKYSLPKKIIFRKNEKTDGCLHLEVLGGAFAMEINQSAPMVIEKINTFFGYTAVGSLKIVQSTYIDTFASSKKNTVNVKKTLVSQKEEIYITELSEEIKSPELREVVKKLGRAVFNNHKQQE